MGDIIPLRRATSSRLGGRLRQESAHRRIGPVDEKKRGQQGEGRSTGLLRPARRQEAIGQLGSRRSEPYGLSRPVTTGSMARSVHRLWYRERRHRHRSRLLPAARQRRLEQSRRREIHVRGTGLRRPPQATPMDQSAQNTPDWYIDFASLKPQDVQPLTSSNCRAKTKSALVKAVNSFFGHPVGPGVAVRHHVPNR